MSDQNVEMGAGTGVQEPVDVGVAPQSFFIKYGTDRDFHVLRCKHTLADLVHDYGKQFLDAYFTADQIIDRIRESYTTLDDADIEVLRSFFTQCTTDAAAKNAFYKELESFLFRNNEVSFDNYDAEYTHAELDALFNAIILSMNGQGPLYWYLDSQSGNIIKKYEDHRKRTVSGSYNNRFCVDAATYADPGSGLDPTKISSLEIVNNDTPITLPRNISSLGKDIRLEFGAPNTVNASWVSPTDPESHIEIHSNERTSSIENVCRMIENISGEDIQLRLDWLFLKTSGDRAQAYSCNNYYDPVQPIFKTLDILASLDAIFYMKCPVLLSGPNHVKLYQFGGQPIQTLSDDEVRELTRLYGQFDGEGKLSITGDKKIELDKFFDTSFNAINDYFSRIITSLEMNKVVIFNKTTDPTLQTPNHAITGFLYTLLDTIEKIHYFQNMSEKNIVGNREQFTTIMPIPSVSENTQVPHKYPIKYKPILGQGDMNEYFRTDLFYNKSSVLYNNIANIFTSVMSNSTNSNMSFMHVKDTLFQEISNNINRFTTSGVCPVNLISLFITILMLAVTIPSRVESTTFSRSGRATLINRAIDQRIVWIKTVINHDALRRQFGLMFTELLVMKVEKDTITYIYKDEKFYDSVHNILITPDSLTISDYTIMEIDFNPTINYLLLSTYVPLFKKIIGWSFGAPLPTGFTTIPDIHIDDINIFRIGEIPRGVVSAPVVSTISIPFIRKKRNIVKKVINKFSKIRPKKIKTTLDELIEALTNIAFTKSTAYRKGSSEIKKMRTDYEARGITKSIFNKMFEKYKPVQGGRGYGFDTLDYPYAETDCYEEEVESDIVGDMEMDTVMEEDDKLEYDDMGGITPAYGSIFETLTKIDFYIDTKFMSFENIIDVSQMIADSILVGSILYNGQEPGDAINVLGEVSQFLNDVNNLYIGNYKDISNKESIETELDIRTESSSASAYGSTKRSLSASTSTVDNHAYFRSLCKRLLNGRFVSNIQILSDTTDIDKTTEDDYFYGIKELYSFITSEMFEQISASSSSFGIVTPPYKNQTPERVHTQYPYTESMLLTVDKNKPVYSPSGETITADSDEELYVKRRRKNNTFNRKIELVEAQGDVKKVPSISSDGHGYASTHSFVAAPPSHNITSDTLEMPYEGGRRSRRRQRKRSTYKKKRASQKRRTYRRHH